MNNNSQWKTSIRLLNELFDRNSMPRLKIVTGDNGDVVCLDQFKKTSYMLLEQCTPSQVVYLRDLIIPGHSEVSFNTNIQTIRYNIIDRIIKQIPYRI